MRIRLGPIVTVVILLFGLAACSDRLPAFVPNTAEATPAVAESTVSPIRSTPPPPPVVTHTVGLDVPCNEWDHFHLADGVCISEQCLFITEYAMCEHYPIGVATVEGFYLKLEKDGIEGPSVCDSFLIVNGPPVLVESIRFLVEEGNQLNSLSDTGQPIINIDTKSLDSGQVSKLESSGPNNTVSLALLALVPTSRGALACGSLFEILALK